MISAVIVVVVMLGGAWAVNKYLNPAQQNKVFFGLVVVVVLLAVFASS